GCGVKSEPIGFLHVLHSSIYRVNALVFNSKAVVERRGFRPKIFDETIYQIFGSRNERTVSH
ncbi:MAG: hypothetical protein PX638_15710, partial [Microcystis sp. M53599_WE4]|nr:hypothetical protein [Microcystis sp. M53599_WE4]